MVRTKGVEATRRNWQAAIGRVPGAYKDGVQRATDTIERAIAAEPLYAAATQQAIAEKRRQKGLEKTSTAEWKTRASNVGSTRIGPGMQAATDKYNRRISDVIQTIESVQLPERTTDPDANIDNRVKPIARALRKLKTGM